MENLRNLIKKIDWGFVFLCSAWAMMGFMLWCKFWRFI